MINYADASLFLQDSLDKQIHIVSEDNTINITNEDIVGESFTLTESLCSEENLIFGSCEPSCIKFTVKNTFPRMYKKWFNVTITLDGSETPFVVGAYRVWGEKPSSDRTTKEITAYDVLYNIFRHTYKRWYKNLWGNSDTMTIKQFRDAWFTRLQSTHPHISQETTTLINDNVVIKKSKKITKPSGKDIFNAICEINGVFGKIGRDGVFHYITLNDSNTTYAINNAQTIEVDYEDYTTSAIDRVEILDPEGEVLGYAGASEDNAENTYTIENNFMLKGLGNDEDAQDTATVLAETLYYDLRYVTFIPFDAEFKGNPCFETGDRISFTAHGSTKTSYILERTMKGIQSLHDNFVAEGDIEYPESVNTYSTKIKELNDRIGIVENTVNEDDIAIQQNEDGSVTFISKEDMDITTYSRHFKVWGYNQFYSYPSWDAVLVNVSSPIMNFVIVGIPVENGRVVPDGTQEAPIPIAGEKETKIYLVGKLQNPNITPTSETQTPTQVKSHVAGLIGGPAETFGATWGYWTADVNNYYVSSIGQGTTFCGFYAYDPSVVDYKIDYWFDTYEDMSAAMLDNEIVVPEISWEYEAKLPTAITGNSVAAVANQINNSIAFGSLVERVPIDFYGDVNIINEDIITKIFNAFNGIALNINKIINQVNDVKIRGQSGESLVDTDKIAYIRIFKSATAGTSYRYYGLVPPFDHEIDADNYFLRSDGSWIALTQGTVVVANPSDQATADLIKVKIAGVTYGIPVGTNVVANPQGTASTDLTKLQVGNSIYRIPVGGQVSALAYKQLTQQEYDALSTAEKNNGTIYFISENSTGVSGYKIITISQNDYNNLTPAEKNNGVPYFVY